LIDYDSIQYDQKVYVLSAEANRLRREHRLVTYLKTEGSLQESRIGNTQLVWIRAQALLTGATTLAKNGPHFFDPPVTEN